MKTGIEPDPESTSDGPGTIGLRQDGVSVGDCYFSGDLGVASLLPLRDGRLALLLAATSAELCGNQPVRRVHPTILH